MVTLVFKTVFVEAFVPWGCHFAHDGFGFVFW